MSWYPLWFQAVDPQKASRVENFPLHPLVKVAEQPHFEQALPPQPQPQLSLDQMQPFRATFPKNRRQQHLWNMTHLSGKLLARGFLICAMKFLSTKYDHVKVVSNMFCNMMLF